MGLKIVKRFSTLAYHFSEKVRLMRTSYFEHRNIFYKRRLYKNIVLSPEQNKETQKVFMHSYGKKFSTKWHRLYTSYTETFCPNYFPEILFSTKLEPITNPNTIAVFLGDKNLLPILFSGEDIHIPKTYVSCINGNLFDENRNPVSKGNALAILKKYKSFVIKKSVDTSSGRDVLIVRNYTEIHDDILDNFGNNYVVQEIIKQSKELAALNPSSINTFRVMTYFCDGNLFVCPISLRMGRSNADRDNIHYGGIVIGVNLDGTLKRTAFSEYGERFQSHPDTGITFNNYFIPEAGNKLRETAKKLHRNVPHLGIISWDLTIDENKQITIIEMNTSNQSAWFPQMVNGEPLFGENTEKMLSMIR